MVANLLQGFWTCRHVPASVQVDKSVEALLLSATLRAGWCLPLLNTAYQSAEMDYFISDAKPAVLVCAGRNFGWLSKMAFLAGTQYVFSSMTTAARCWSGIR